MIIKIIISKYLKNQLEKNLKKIKELTYKVNQNDLMYYFKGNTFRERFDDFNNSI